MRLNQHRIELNLTHSGNYKIITSFVVLCSIEYYLFIFVYM